MEVIIPQDMRKYKDKLVGPFTGKQAAFGIAGAALEYLIVYPLTKGLTMEMQTFPVMVIAAICWFFSSIEPYGMPPEKFVTDVLLPLLLEPKHKVYKIRNKYEYLTSDSFKKEIEKHSKKRKIKKQRSRNPELQMYI